MSEQSVDREHRLQQALVAAIEAAETGDVAQRDAVLARHPDFAAELREFFAGRSRVERLAEPLRAAAPAADAPTTGLSASAPSISPLGTKLQYFGDYELLEEIGRGGMGVVYKARQVSLKRIVALKMILAGQLADDADVRRFHAEAEAAAKLDHPGIVPVFEVGVHEGHQYFTMAFVEGKSLALKVLESLPAPREAATLMKQVAEAVAYAHLEGVVHRDLKPANILVDKNGQPRLTDFGLAKRVQRESGATGADLTHTGQVLGTPSYMPPEQASGKRGVVGPLSDVYSLGAVLYALLTGRPPFQAATALDTLLQVLDQEPAPPRQLNRSIPRDLEVICLKCLEKEPSKRYASARDLVADLDRYLTGQPIHARPASWRERVVKWMRRRPAAAALLGVSAAVLIGFVIFGTIYLNNARRLVVVERARGELLRSHIYSSDLALAVVAFEKQNVTTMQDYLEALRPKPGEPDLRGFEWHYLWRQMKRELRSLPAVMLPDDDSERMTDRRRLVFSPDGKLLATRKQVCDVASGRVVLEFDDVPGSQIFFSPDSRFVFNGTQILSIATADGGKAAGVKVPLIPATDLPPDKIGRRFRTAPSMPLGFLPNNALVVLHPDLSPPDAWSKGERGDQPAASVKSYDAATGNETVHKFQVRKGYRIITAALAEKRGLLAVASAVPETASNWVNKDDVEIWDLVQGGRKLIQFDKLGEKVHWGNEDLKALTFSPDGTALAVATRDYALRLWDLESGQERVQLVPNNRRHIAFSADSKYFMQIARVSPSPQGGYEKAQLEIWDVGTGKQLVSPDISHAGYTGSFGQQPEAALSPDGRIYATGGGTRVVQLWDTTTGKLRATFLSHKHPIRDLVFSPDGTILATQDHQRMSPKGESIVKLWDTAEKKPIGLPVDTSAITTFAPSPDARTVAVGYANGMIRICEVSSLKVIAFMKRHTTEVHRLEFSKDGKLLAVSHLGGAKDLNIDVWDPAGPKLIASFPGFLKGFDGKVVASISSLDRYLGSPTPPDTITFYDVATRAPRVEIKDTYDKVFGMSPDGSVAATATNAPYLEGRAANYRTRVWHTATGKETLPPDAFDSRGNRPSHLIFSPDSKLLAMCNTNLEVRKEGAKESEYPSAGRLYELATGKTKVQFPLAYRYGESVGGISNWTMAEFSPDSKILLTIGNDGDKYRAKVSLWDTATGKEVTSLPNAETFACMHAAFAPDGKTVAVVTIGSWHCDRYRDGKRIDDDSAIRIEREDINYDGDSSGSSGGGALGSIHPVYEVHVWDVSGIADANGQNRSSIPQHRRRFLVSWQAPIHQFQFSGDGQTIYILTTRRSNDGGAGSPRRLQAWDVATGKEIASIGDHGTRFHALAYASDGRLLALTDQILNQRRPRNHPGDYKIRTWDVEGRKELAPPRVLTATEMPLDLDPISLAVAPNTPPRSDGWESVFWYGAHSSTAFSPDGKVKAMRVFGWPVQATGPDGKLKITPSPMDVTLVDMAGDKAIHTLKGYSQSVCRLAFTPDGRTLAVGDYSGKIYLWNVAAGRMLLTIDAHRGPVTGLAFRGDGRVLASSSEAEIRLWNAETGE